MPAMTEEQAIKALRDLAKRWPKSLWLFSASGHLNVMRYADNGERVLTEGGAMDQAASLATIAIPNDGGDW